MSFWVVSRCRATARRLARHASHQCAPHPDTVTNLLHKTTSLLPRILPTESREFWHDLLNCPSTSARIAVYGVDEFSGAHDLVTALLEDPLASDQAHNEQIRDRWKNRTQRTLLISQESSSNPEYSTFKTSSPHLHQYHFPLEIIEILPAPSPSSVFDHATSKLLLTADLAIIICNPVTTSLSALLCHPLLRDNPDAILILTCTASSQMVQSLERRILSAHQSSSRPFPGPKILFMDPTRAVAAIATLESDPRSSTVVQKYQDEFVGSRMSTLTTALRERFSLSPGTSLRDQALLARIHVTLSTLRDALKRAKSEMHSVSLAVNQLNNSLEETRVKAHTQVFHRPCSKSTVEDAVAYALEQANKNIKPIIHHLTWWRLLWRIDEISSILGQVVQKTWCRDLEKQLIMQTGYLATLQNDTINSIYNLLAIHNNPPFNSTVFLNSLQQLITSPSHKTTTDTLIHPIDTRRTQITQHLTTQLHIAGERAILGMSGGIVTGAGVSWAGWVGWLSGSGEGMLGFVGLDPGTAVGMGVLVAVASVRWAAGKWERSKRRWWEDWNRVGDGLEQDLKVTFDRTMQDKVLGVAAYGCDKLSEIVEERRREIEELQGQVDALTGTLDDFARQSS